MNENKQRLRNEDLFNNSIQFTINEENMECLLNNLSSDFSQGFSYSYLYEEVIEADYLLKEDIYRQRGELFKFPKTIK